MIDNDWSSQYVEIGRLQAILTSSLRKIYPQFYMKNFPDGSNTPDHDILHR